MRQPLITALLSATLALPALAGFKHADNDHNSRHSHQHRQYHQQAVELGPRPFFLVDDMDQSPLKNTLSQCEKGPFKTTDFSIGHRGAPLQFPEHTEESYRAAATMGAGILECDVTFTNDKELVCRHSQCDLHTTTNILQTPLAEQCSQNFQPAVFDSEGNVVQPASAQCCTSDISLAEFKSLQGKMDAANPAATTVDEYLNGTANWRTDLYASRGTLLSHKESIALFKQLKVKMTPELKSASVEMPFDGFSQQDYADKLIAEYREARVRPAHVWPQSFNLADVTHWINAHPAYGRQAVYLDGRDAEPTFDIRDPSSWQPSMAELHSAGVNIIAPPLWMLLDVDNGDIVPSPYAVAAKRAGLDIIAWSFERSGPLANGGGWYYQTLNGSNTDPANPQASVIDNDGDMYEVLHALATEVGILGIFSDWPATVSYYASCMKLK